MDFFSSLSLRSPNAHCVAAGELDAFAADDLRHRMDNVVDRGCIHFTLDLSEVTFVDAGGLGTLVWLSNTVAPYGGTVAVVAASPRFQQVAALVGLGEAFGIDLLPDPASPPVRVVPIDRRTSRAGRRLALVPPPVDRGVGGETVRLAGQLRADQ